MERATKAEILAALSHALDLVEGQPEGHAVRTCLLASRIAEEMALSDQDRDSLYFAALLKDSGCSSNSARIHKIFGGDEMLVKQGVKTVDWSSPLESIKYAIGATERGNGVVSKLRRMLGNLGPPAKVMDEVTLARCTQGAAIARQLGFDEAVAQAVEHLDEHWDGRGSPRHLRGDEIPVLARILGLAQTLEVFFTTFGLTAAMDMLDRREGTWFDPVTASAARSLAGDRGFWELLRAHAEESVQHLPIGAASAVADETDIDQICVAFAMIVDAKSSFTAAHSSRVTDVAVELGMLFEFDHERLRTLRRAALLHDIGKLGVPNSILEKPGRLDAGEFDRVQQHPRHSFEILKPIRAFDRVADIAAAHHERLDGSGYWRGLTASELDLDMRILAVADVFDALSAERPYREALPLPEVFAIMDREAGTGLDAACVDALRARKMKGIAMPQAA
jgi:putative nucleotidyltransferase with HDIG domain